MNRGLAGYIEYSGSAPCSVRVDKGIAIQEAVGLGVCNDSGLLSVVHGKTVEIGFVGFLSVVFVRNLELFPFKNIFAEGAVMNLPGCSRFALGKRFSRIDYPDSRQSGNGSHERACEIFPVEDVLFALIRKETALYRVGRVEFPEFAEVFGVPCVKLLRYGIQLRARGFKNRRLIKPGFKKRKKPCLSRQSEAGKEE